jgi:hypothetical protein
VNSRALIGARPGTLSESGFLWHCRLLYGVLCFQDRNASQQATQQVGSGDDAPLRTPHQDQIVVDDIVLGPLLHNLQAPDDLAEPRLDIPAR